MTGGAANILEEISSKTRERIAVRRREIPLSEVRAQAEDACAHGDDEGCGGKSFIKALRKQGMSYICEVKKASPSKGIIAEHFPYLDIARRYEEAGASAISCLTEPFYFQGSDKYLKEITSEVAIPVLRKDFTVDEYMIYEAKLLGASAVLLICSILGSEQLNEYLALTESLGMDALVEAHDADEVDTAVKAGAHIIGVNNRDLKTFEIDMHNSINLRNLAPDSVIFVSESGIRTKEDIKILYDNRVDAVLIGETLMRSENKKEALERLNGGPLAAGHESGKRGEQR